jgi:conjugal transfer pilus assembly protein TraK
LEEKEYQEGRPMKVAKLLTTMMLFSPIAIATQNAVITKTDTDVRSVHNENEPTMFVISNSHVNRIVTPFDNPSLKMDAVGGVQYQQHGNVLYMATKKDTRGSIAAFITEKGDESVVIPVVFKPMLVGPQQIEVGANVIGGSNIARKFERSNYRTDTITSVLSTLAKGHLPSGYQITNISSQYLPSCTQEGLTFDFYRGQLARGGDYVVMIGTVKNSSNEVVEFKENNCYADAQIAVSSYPKNRLLPNEVSEVFVMQYRDKPMIAPQSDRKSLLEH